MKKIGIVAAMDVEVKLLKEALENAETINVAGSEIYTGTIGDYEVALMKCGIGKVAAACGTQTLILACNPDCIINTGCAGALAKEIKIGDIVLSDATAEWDMDTTPIGDPRGFNFSLGLVRVPADKDLADMIEKAIPDDIDVTRGLVVSGDQFIASDDQRNAIFASFPDALCAEMEGASVGHVCGRNKVPFCVLRCMSDSAEGDSSISYSEFCTMASEKSASILLKLMGK